MINKHIADIVLFLNTEELSPYKGKFTLPYSKIFVELNYRRVKPLIKQCVKVLNLDNIPEENHKFIFLNYLIAIKDSYNGDWDSKDNPFFRYFSFAVSMDLLKLFIMEAFFIRDFSKESFSNLLHRKIDLEKFNAQKSWWAEEYIQGKLMKSVDKVPTDKIEIKY